ncbi:MAG: GNAT family N-acetyltransferase [Alphaproteobacteria bacterium]|nr:GNAT family N-acetyltransferase [Alphaproteobacteria bacterium]MDE2337362.1 GNAT family N-acetyltransferase [Alphaproteobacteria bacterium]
MSIVCQEITAPDELQACFALRHAVFVGEQNVEPSLETDGMDAEARHFALKDGGRIIATCRVRRIGSAAKIERMAVARNSRRRGIGLELMKYVLHDLMNAGDIQLLKLSAQSDAVPFYERLSFRKRGPEYIEANMPHYEMIREL